MSLPSNDQVYEAIAKVLTCRDSRRGRKPPLIVTIITGEDGKTIVTDHNTGCTSAIGKRAYKKRTPRHGDGTPISKATLKAIKRGCDDSNNGKVTEYDASVRISPRTGKPVRTYKQRIITDITPPPAPLSYADTLSTTIAEHKVLLAQTKMALAGAEHAGNTTLINIYTKTIAQVEKRLEEAVKALDLVK